MQQIRVPTAYARAAFPEGNLLRLIGNLKPDAEHTVNWVALLESVDRLWSSQFKIASLENRVKNLPKLPPVTLDLSSVATRRYLMQNRFRYPGDVTIIGTERMAPLLKGFAISGRLTCPSIRVTEDSTAGSIACTGDISAAGNIRLTNPREGFSCRSVRSMGAIFTNGNFNVGGDVVASEVVARVVKAQSLQVSKLDAIALRVRDQIDVSGPALVRGALEMPELKTRPSVEVDRLNAKDLVLTGVVDVRRLMVSGDLTLLGVSSVSNTYQWHVAGALRCPEGVTQDFSKIPVISLSGAGRASHSAQVAYEMSF